jgi:N-acetylglutamate synthase-like GNAT family acetyltransferase
VIRRATLDDVQDLATAHCACDPAEALINATCVRPDAARRGIGRTLVAVMEAAARASGATEVRLNATLNAVGFYETLGYSRAGDASNRLPSGVELPCVVMIKTDR